MPTMPESLKNLNKRKTITLQMTRSKYYVSVSILSTILYYLANKRQTQTLLAQRQINDFNMPSFNLFLIAATRWLSSLGRWWGIGWVIQRGLKIVLKILLGILLAVLIFNLSTKA